MSESGSSPEKKSGCGLLGAVFGRRGFWLRRATSAGSLPVVNNSNNNNNNNNNNDDNNGIGIKVSRDSSSSKRRRGGGACSEDGTLSDGSDVPPKPVDRVIPRPGPNHVKQQAQMYQMNQGRRPMKNETGMVTSGGAGMGRKIPKEAIGISGELESMIADHQKSKGGGSLVRASSGNVMLYGNLGNLRQPGNYGNNDVMSYLPKTGREEIPMSGGKYTNGVMGGNVVKASNEPPEVQPPPSLCRAISTRMDPETLKIMGNEDFKNGRFAEALALYDAAISIDPNKASYRSNKSAALTALGRILEAVFECREAIRIEPYYHRAHQRLGTLYLRLGEAEKALYHYKHAGSEVDPDDITKAKKLQANLCKCTEAKKQRDWHTLLKETAIVISTGADSAPQIYALQAESLLRLRRHQEADEALMKGPKFDVDECTKFFGTFGNASLLVVRAQVDMAAGRFDDAMGAAQRAARLDSNCREATMVLRRARAVAAARANGNELFKAAKYSEACTAYGEGLDHDPYNSVLLCNRAACRSKLGQLEKAVEDCSMALNVRPSYTKARLRRADCYTKMEKWEASIQDYEILVRENPEDEEVSRGLQEARAKLKRQRGQDNGNDTPLELNEDPGDDVVLISSSDNFKEFSTSQGITVVLFFKPPMQRPISQLMLQLQKRYSSIKFFKVDAEEQRSLARSEGANSIPCFKIYKDGSRVKEVAGDNEELLESSIKYYDTT